ncbi:ABC transporter permease [Mesorhizobium sp. LSHC412B00]|uniref:ABC transporter permease n=1 Tax=Mesorhizobium sp. LSHC412B00 TaxID=1287285 RepID=UPI0003CDDABE|nr:ABC transporter permease [Mesorhizobium sp. LSHC412B00]ESX90862.1 ABC transporter permease [Mesorhizobium sp. LSHC412B00]
MATPEHGIPALEVRDLNVYYERSHALQGVSLTLSRGVMSVVGRNGMGKTTLCKAIMGILPAASGSVAFRGWQTSGARPAEIARAGIGYVPQGRRLWRSLTVDEHLRLVATKGGAWTPERVYSIFPRLAERRQNGGAQLSGGEQQMLAIGRALLTNPKLLVMDEPTEGLAPVIVDQVAEMLVDLGQQGDIDVLVIEQNIGVACAVARDVAIMVNGRISRIIDAHVLAGDRDLQQTLLGVGRHAHDEIAPAAEPAASIPASSTKIYVSNPVAPTRWTPPVPVGLIEGAARTMTPVATIGSGRADPSDRRKTPSGGVVYVCGTLDTKGIELCFMRHILKGHGLNARLVDLSTTGKPSGAEIPPYVIAALHPRGAAGVFTGDRGSAVAGMTLAFEAWMKRQTDIAGLLAAGGSGGTAMVAPAFRVPAIGVPKLIVSTVASGNTAQYVGPADIIMMHSVADVQGINSITREVLGNAANALAGMVKARLVENPPAPAKPAIGLTMFGVTTPCVDAITSALSADYDCLVFHATGTGGRAMEKLVDSKLLDGVIDITTTELCDMVAGGVFAADETRFEAMIRSGRPYIGAAGALDMVNFNAPETVPERYRDRLFYRHNPQITLMRTTVEENVAIARFLGAKLNRMTGPVRFFLPEGGLSLLDAPGKPFWDPEADAALFKTLENVVQQNANRQLIRVKENINDPDFAQLVVRTFRSLHTQTPAARKGA